jgi:hypothetical protein
MGRTSVVGSGKKQSGFDRRRYRRIVGHFRSLDRGYGQARILSVLEDQFPETVATQPELLAQHAAEAGSAEKPVIYWLNAGRRGVVGYEGSIDVGCPGTSSLIRPSKVCGVVGSMPA